MTVELTTKTLKIVGADYIGDADMQDTVATAYGLVSEHDAQTAAIKLSTTVAVARLVNGGMSQKDLAAHVCKMSGGYVSKAVTVGKAFMYATDDSEYDPTMADLVGNLEAYWDLATSGQGAGSFCALAIAMASDVGEERSAATVAVLDVFGALENVYNVAKGNRLHPDDPRNDAGDDDGDGDGDDDGEPDDGEPTAWQDMMANVIGVARAQGATASEIASVVTGLLGS